MIFPDCARPVFYRPHRAISLMILSLPPLICYRGHFPVPRSIENLLLRLLTGWPLLTINCLDYTSIDVNFPSSLVCPLANSEYRDVKSSRYSSNSSCHPLSGICAVRLFLLPKTWEIFRQFRFKALKTAELPCCLPNLFLSAIICTFDVNCSVRLATLQNCLASCFADSSTGVFDLFSLSLE